MLVQRLRLWAFIANEIKAPVLVRACIRDLCHWAEKYSARHSMNYKLALSGGIPAISLFSKEIAPSCLNKKNKSSVELCSNDFDNSLFISLFILIVKP